MPSQASQSLTPQRVLTLLAETPTRIAALTADVAPVELQTSPNLDAWSANQLLAILEPLPPDGWSRAATVRRAGTAFEWTVLFCAQQLAIHEHEHIEQIEGIVTAVRNLAR